MGPEKKHQNYTYNHEYIFALLVTISLSHLTHPNIFFQKIENEVKKEVDEATVIAKKDQEIPLEDLSADVNATFLEPEIRNILPWSPLKHKRVGPAVNAK